VPRHGVGRGFPYAECLAYRADIALAGDIRERLEDAMKNFALKVQRFLASEDGPTAVEYAVMLALIVIVCLTAIRSIGQQAASTFNSVSGQLAGTP
jgi:pilus assembly protein Flp/PilA